MYFLKEPWIFKICERGVICSGREAVSEATAFCVRLCKNILVWDFSLCLAFQQKKVLLFNAQTALWNVAV